MGRHVRASDSTSLVYVMRKLGILFSVRILCSIYCIYYVICIISFIFILHALAVNWYCMNHI